MNQMKNKLIKLIFNKTYDIIHSIEFLKNNRISDKYFTRKRKMSFVNIITFILNFLSKPLQLELDKYFENNKNEARISQQAFSKARQHIKPEAFKTLFEMTSEVAINSEELTRYKGYRLFAIDGTEIYLEPTEELIECYGSRYKDACTARVSILCETNNGIIIDAEIDSNKIDERTLALRNIEKFEKIKQEKDILIFDRGYPSNEIIEKLENKRIKYLMRVQKGFNKEIDSDKRKDYWITIRKAKVRIIKTVLETGEMETLITNLDEKEFETHEFKELYFKRWPIETKYNTVKNKLKIEAFSGKTKISVLQDFYATMYLSNIVSISKMTCNEEIDKENKNKNLKYRYQVNEGYLISKLKDRLVLALLIKSSRKREKAVDEILMDAIKNRLPIKPGRHCKRPGNTSHGLRKRAPRRVIKNIL